MKPITLGELIYIIDGEYRGDSSSLSEPILSINPNARDIRPGDLFWKHFPYDSSYDMLRKAFRDGGLAHICLEKNYRDYMRTYPTVIVKSSDEASLRLMQILRPRIRNKIISVGGSLGKTSTTDMIASVLAEKYSVVKTTPHSNTPGTLYPAFYKLYLDDSAVGVFEMCLDPKGAYAGTNPDYIVVTNISSNHSEAFGGIEGVYKAKIKVIESSKPEAKVFLWMHDEWLSKCHVAPPREIIWLGNTDDVAYSVKNYNPNGIYGSRFDIKTPSLELSVNSKYPGFHQTQICLTAAAIGELFGLDSSDIMTGISKCTFSYPRSQVFNDEFFCFLDTYNLRKTSICYYLDMLNGTETGKTKVFITSGFHTDSTDIKQNKSEYVALGRHAADVDCKILYSGANVQDFAEGYRYKNNREEHLTGSVFDLPDSIQLVVKPNSLVCVAGSSLDEEGLQNIQSIIKRHNYNLKKAIGFPCLYGNNYALLSVEGDLIDGYGENEPIVQHCVAPLITAFLAVEEGLLDKGITVSSKINYGSFFGGVSKLECGDSLTIRDMVYATLFSGTNDLCYLISKQIPDYFTKATRILSKLNCTKTNIVAPYASHENRSTALETAKVLQYCLRNPEFKQIFVKDSHTFSTQSQEIKCCNVLSGDAEGASIAFSHYYETAEGEYDYIRWQASALLVINGFAFAEGNFLTYEQENTKQIFSDIDRVRRYCISLSEEYERNENYRSYTGEI